MIKKFSRSFSPFAAIVVAFSLNALAADYTAKITDSHLCCDKCVTGVDKAVSGVNAVSATADKSTDTITITAPDQATAQRAADALMKAGYYGKSTDVKMTAITGAKDATVQKMQVNGVHLCCPKCVKAVDTAVKAVPGVTADTATKGAHSFEVTGNFNEKQVMDSLQKAGLTGTVTN